MRYGTKFPDSEGFLRRLFRVSIYYSAWQIDSDLEIIGQLPANANRQAFRRRYVKLGCGIAPIQVIRQRGITVGLGTDGAGSATTLDCLRS